MRLIRAGNKAVGKLAEINRESVLKHIEVEFSGSRL